MKKNITSYKNQLLMCGSTWHNWQKKPHDKERKLTVIVLVLYILIIIQLLRIIYKTETFTFGGNQKVPHLICFQPQDAAA